MKVERVGYKSTVGSSFRRAVLPSKPLRLPMHPNTPSHDQYRSWMSASDRPLAIDLFSGAGGLSYGLEAAGYRVALAVDFNGWALETHAHNFEGVALQLDLGDPDIQDSIINLFKGIDVALIAGGPPCQPFSRAGRSKIRSLVNEGARDPEDHRRQLWRAFFNIVERIRPRAVLMENVPDMALGDDMAILRHILALLEKAEYEADARIVDTWEYGVPQYRQRLVVVGIRNGGKFVWPSPVDRVTLREAIGDLPVLDPTLNEVGSVVMPYEGARSDFQRQARKHCDGESSNLIFDHTTRAVRPDDLEAFRLMKPGMLYSDLPKELRRYRSDIFDDKYNRLAWDDLSRSITAHIAKDGYWYIHPSQHRTLTVREAARIQTFPDHFRFAGTRSHQFAQIGNAVPPAVGEAVGGAILEATRGRRVRKSERTSVWLGLIRSRLYDWGIRDRSIAIWAYPSDPWTVLVGLLFGGRGSTGLLNPAEVLDLVPTLEDATPQMLNVLNDMETPGWRHDAVQKLQKTVETLRTDSDRWNGSAWLEAADLGHVARKWLNLLAFDDGGLVPSSSVLRVVARITDRNVDERNCMSKGRMALAVLVGSGVRAASINAAMHRLGNRVCLPQNPVCKDCPVKRLCRSASC